MENVNTYRAIITGMVILFAGCLIWLMTSRQQLSRVSNDLDETRLKNESLLSEKLLTEKDLDKKTRQTESLEERIKDLNETLEHRSAAISTKTEENRQIKMALKLANERQEKSNLLTEELTQKLKLESDRYTGLKDQHRSKTDSLHLLQNTVASLEAQLHDAITRSIDQTLVQAEKRNNKLTSKAKRADVLVANVELPAMLDKLSFVVEGPDGAVLSNNAGTVSVRQIASTGAVTASLENMPASLSQTKKMEVIYNPEEKLEPGTYLIKIYNNSDYVGTMRISLR